MLGHMFVYYFIMAWMLLGRRPSSCSWTSCRFTKSEEWIIDTAVGACKTKLTAT